MDLEFYVRVRTCEKRVTGKQPLTYDLVQFHYGLNFDLLEKHS